MERTRRTINVALAFACVATGGVVCAWLIESKPAAPKRSSFSHVLEVTVEPVDTSTEQTPVVGYGSVRAKNEVKIVPQVSGQLTFVHEDLATGNEIPKGELLFKIDPTIYKSQVRQAEAEVRRLEASLERADQELANLDERIANARQMLAIDERDYLASKRLYEEEEVGTARDVDVVQQKYFRQNDAVVELESRRSIIPHVKLETEAQLDVARARLNQTQHNLKHTRIHCPFDARVELVAAYNSQVVTAHLSIATLTDLSAFELSVGIDPRELRWLAEAIRPDALKQDLAGDRPTVALRWSLHGQEFNWRGHVSRFERVDEATRMARLVVEVRDVDMVATVGMGSESATTTLAIGMHCRAELPAEPLEQALLVPRHVIYDNHWVYVFEADDQEADVRTGRLGRRAVPLLRSSGDSVLVDYAGRQGTEVCELKPGELVVVSPLVKPVVGMALRLHDERIAAVEPMKTGQPQSIRVRPAVLGQLAPTRIGS